MNLTQHIWRQAGPEASGRIKTCPIDSIADMMCKEQPQTEVFQYPVRISK